LGIGKNSWQKNAPLEKLQEFIGWLRWGRRAQEKALFEKERRLLRNLGWLETFFRRGKKEVRCELIKEGVNSRRGVVMGGSASGRKNPLV